MSKVVFQNLVKVVSDTSKYRQYGARDGRGMVAGWSLVHGLHKVIDLPWCVVAQNHTHSKQQHMKPTTNCQ